MKMSVYYVLANGQDGHFGKVWSFAKMQAFGFMFLSTATKATGENLKESGLVHVFPIAGLYNHLIPYKVVGFRIIHF